LKSKSFTTYRVTVYYRVHENVYGENENVNSKIWGKDVRKRNVLSGAVEGKCVMRAMTECPMGMSSRERLLQ